MVSVAERHACALDMAGALWCWGDDSQLKLGDNGMNPSSIVPARKLIDRSGPWQYVAHRADGRAVGIKTVDHSLWCWGDNNHNDLGIGSLGSPLSHAARGDRTPGARSRSETRLRVA